MRDENKSDRYAQPMYNDEGIDDIESRKDLVMACKILDKFDVFDEQGHFSARTEPGANTIWINELTSPGTAGLEEFVKLDITDEDTWPDTLPAEIVMHTEVYHLRDDVNSICHNHSPYSIIVGSAGLEMRPLHTIGFVQRNPITVYQDYDDEGGMLVVTEEEGKKVAELLGGDRAIHLRGHGNIVVGRTIAETVVASLRLEYNSMLLYRTASVGEPWYMPQHLADEHAKIAYTRGGFEKSFSYHLANVDRP
jgi:HCOMODA/2-hydroxy-3-carboxy-muconic semialdehyde decarboxylase